MRVWDQLSRLCKSSLNVSLVLSHQALLYFRRSWRLIFYLLYFLKSSNYMVRNFFRKTEIRKCTKLCFKMWAYQVCSYPKKIMRDLSENHHPSKTLPFVCDNLFLYISQTAYECIHSSYNVEKQSLENKLVDGTKGIPRKEFTGLISKLKTWDIASNSRSSCLPITKLKQQNRTTKISLHCPMFSKLFDKQFLPKFDEKGKNAQPPLFPEKSSSISHTSENCKTRGQVIT